jgi:hypothetical protein
VRTRMPVRRPQAGRPTQAPPGALDVADTTWSASIIKNRPYRDGRPRNDFNPPGRLGKLGKPSSRTRSRR